MTALAAAHSSPGGIVVWTLAVATLAALVALAYGLRALRGRLPRKRPVAAVAVSAQPRDTQPYTSGVIVAGPDREESS